MIIKNAGRKDVQGKLPVIVDDGVARIAPSLEADDDIDSFASISVILPFPSSPQLAPTIARTIVDPPLDVCRSARALSDL